MYKFCGKIFTSVMIINVNCVARDFLAKILNVNCATKYKSARITFVNFATREDHKCELCGKRFDIHVHTKTIDVNFAARDLKIHITSV